MASSKTAHLCRRERQMMDVIYERGQASVAEVRAGIPDPPGYSAVRAKLGVLERKGHLSHKSDGAKYVYFPKVSRTKARRSAHKQLVQTFFDGSTGSAVTALLEMERSKLTPVEVKLLTNMIDQAKQEGR